MDNEVRWDQIRYFLAVAQAGSAVAAGRRLGVSHATVMRNIAQLEASLGVRLFDHVRTGYRVTADAEEVLASARSMEEHANALVRQALGRDPTPDGVLKLALADASLFDAMRLLRDFRTAHPRIELVAEDGHGAASGRLSQLHTDAAIVVTNTPPEDLVGRQIGRVQLRWYVAPGYQERRAPGSADDCDWIVWSSRDADLDEAWQRAQLRRLTSRPRVVLRTHKHSEALAAVRAGIGAALLSEANGDELHKLAFGGPRQSFGVWLLTHPDLRRSGRVRQLFDFVAGVRAR